MTSNVQFPDDCPAWLAAWISRADERLGNIEKTLVRLVKRTAKNNPKSDQLTFKWIVEKLVVPAGFVLAGYLFARGG